MTHERKRKRERRARGGWDRRKEKKEGEHDWRFGIRRNLSSSTWQLWHLGWVTDSPGSVCPRWNRDSNAFATELLLSSGTTQIILHGVWRLVNALCQHFLNGILLTSHHHLSQWSFLRNAQRGRGEGAQACPEEEGRWEDGEDHTGFSSPQRAPGSLTAHCTTMFSLQANFVSNYLLCSWICWPHIWRTVLYLLQWSKTGHIYFTLKSHGWKITCRTESSEDPHFIFFASGQFSFNEKHAINKAEIKLFNSVERH